MWHLRTKLAHDFDSVSIRKAEIDYDEVEFLIAYRRCSARAVPTAVT